MSDDRIDIHEWMGMSPTEVSRLFADERRRDPGLERFSQMLVKTLTGNPSEERMRGVRVEFEALRPIARLAVWSELTSNRHPIDLVMLAHSHLVDGVLSCFRGITEPEKNA